MRGKFGKGNRMSQNTFKRVEIKYLLTKDQYLAIREKLADYMEEDEYGLSTIQSIYYDTENYDLIRDSLEKPVYKEKLRLRAYGKEITDDTNVFLELKKKYEGIVYKRRISLPYGEAINYLENGVYPKKDSQILKEIDYFIKYHNPTRRTYISYDRIAMYAKADKDLRITFDKSIRATFERNSFKEGKKGEFLLNDGERLMEIKVAGAMPLWLTGILSELEIYPNTFSKYGKACRMFLAYEGFEEDHLNTNRNTVENEEKVPFYGRALCIRTFA